MRIGPASISLQIPFTHVGHEIGRSISSSSVNSFLLNQTIESGIAQQRVKNAKLRGVYASNRSGRLNASKMSGFSAQVGVANALSFRNRTAAACSLGNDYEANSVLSAVLLLRVKTTDHARLRDSTRLPIGLTFVRRVLPDRRTAPRTRGSSQQHIGDSFQVLNSKTSSDNCISVTDGFCIFTGVRAARVGR